MFLIEWSFSSVSTYIISSNWIMFAQDLPSGIWWCNLPSSTRSFCGRRVPRSGRIWACWGSVWTHGFQHMGGSPSHSLPEIFEGEPAPQLTSWMGSGISPSPGDPPQDGTECKLGELWRLQVWLEWVVQLYRGFAPNWPYIIKIDLDFHVPT